MTKVMNTNPQAIRILCYGDNIYGDEWRWRSD